MAAMEQTRWTAVLFDFDGTLGDSIDLIISSVRATAAELPGYTFDEAAIRPWIGRPLTAMLLEQGVTDQAQWMTVYRRHYRRAHGEMLRPIEGMSGLLERLANAGARIGVVSSKKAEYIELGLNRLGLGSWIDVVGADNTQRHKPDLNRSCMQPDCSTRRRRTASMWETLSPTSLLVAPPAWRPSP